MRLLESARIIWAITSKDILEAFKNKNLLTVLISVLFMVVFYRYMNEFLREVEPPAVLIYDAGESTGAPSALVSFLQNSDTVSVYTYKSEAGMKERLTHGDLPELGLVIPAGFDQSLQSGEPLVLQGYVLRWVKPEDAAGLQRSVAAEIAALLGNPVQVNIEGNTLQLNPDSRGLGVQAGMAMVFSIVMISISLLGNLMLEEKQVHTLDALRVSPASAAHLVLSKALTGIFYCLLMAAVAALLNQALIVHWWLLFLAVLAGSLFTIGLGLLLGMAIDNRGQLTLLAWVMILPLFLPLMFVLLEELLPAWLVKISTFIPTTALFDLVLASFAGEIQRLPTLLKLGQNLVCAAAVLLVVVWQVKRQDAGEPAVFLPDGLRKYFSARRQAARPVARLPKPEPAKHAHQPGVAVAKMPSDQPVQQSGWLANLRIIWAITAKDVREAIHNKLILSIVLASMFIVLSNSLLPLLIERTNQPTAIVYDAGQSTLLRAAALGEGFRVRPTDSREEMESILTSSPVTYLGLILPADFDSLAGSSQVIEVQAYAAHWADQEKISQWITFFEQQLSQASWSPVRIQMAPEALYPDAEVTGQNALLTLSVITVLITVGLALVPILLVDEKESHTLSALLVSPANISLVVAGKALAGVLYCMAAALVGVILNQAVFIHWGLVILVLVICAVFVVAMGMLIGMVANTPTSAATLAGPLLFVLLIPTMVRAFRPEGWPALVKTILDWQPGSLMINLIKLPMIQEVPQSLLWSNAAALMAMAGAVFLGVYLLARRNVYQ
jgi:ABC-type Na+ efflux pump permease subunit